MTSGITENNFGFLLSEAARLMRKRFAQRARTIGLTGAQWRVLAYVTRWPGINQATLADYLEVEPITLSRLIDRMETAGLVQRRVDPHDRRARNLHCTDRAAPLMAELKLVSRGLIEDAQAGISEQDIQITQAVLMRIRNNMSDSN